MSKRAIISSRVQSIIDSLEDKLDSTTKTGILDEINSRIGTLSAPSKMPCHSWSIPATFCKTGSKLAKVQGTPCSVCYAMRNRYPMPNVHKALCNRLDHAYLRDWHKLMAIRILLHKEKYFRWFDAGDIQDDRMLFNIFNVANLTPEVQHWIPTQERLLVSKYIDQIPPNVVIRISSPKMNLPFKSNILGTLSSSVATTKEYSSKNGEHICPSLKQGNKCGECRACWDKKVEHVVYLQH